MQKPCQDSYYTLSSSYAMKGVSYGTRTLA